VKHMRFLTLSVIENFILVMVIGTKNEDDSDLRRDKPKDGKQNGKLRDRQRELIFMEVWKIWTNNDLVNCEISDENNSRIRVTCKAWYGENSA
jgi:hypothetical protein